MVGAAGFEPARALADELNDTGQTQNRMGQDEPVIGLDTVIKNCPYAQEGTDATLCPTYQRTLEEHNRSTTAKDSLQELPDELRALVTAWHDLPEAIRTGITAMARAFL